MSHPHPHSYPAPLTGPIFPEPHADEEPDIYGEYHGQEDYPIESWVVIDDITAPCTPQQLATGLPTILDGLSFGWGRDTSVDQPGANTCSFTLREELHFKDEGVNQVTDPTFSDPEMNAIRFPPEFEVEGGQVTIAPDAGVPNQAFDPSFADVTGISAGGSSNFQVGGTVNGFPTPMFGTTELMVRQNSSGTDTTLLYPTAYVQNNTSDGSVRPTTPPLERGKTYNASIYVRAEPGGTMTNANALKLNLIMNYDDGTQDAGWAMSEAGTADNTWQRLSIAFTVPDNAARIGFRLIANYIGDSLTGGKSKTYWDGLQITEGPELREYRDSENISSDNADSYRVWLIGNRLAAPVTNGPVAPAPENGAIPVIPGQALHMALTVSASVNNREIRWQIARYRADGSIITSSTYVASNTKVPGPNQAMRFEADYVIPDDGTAYVAVAFVPEGTFGGSVTFSDPDIYFGGGQTAMDTIHVGSSVEIWCRAEIPPYDAEVYSGAYWGQYNNQELGAENWTVIAGDRPDTLVHLGRSTATGSDPTYLQLTKADDYDWSTTICLAPSPFDTTGTNPTSWDLIPRLAPGGTWQASLRVQVPPGTVATLKAWAFSGPEKTDRAGEIPIPEATRTAAGSYDQLTGGLAWLDLSGSITLPTSLSDAAGYWVCLGVEIAPMASPVTWNDPNIADLAWRDIVLRWIDLNLARVQPPSLLQAEATIRTSLIWSGEVTSAIAQAAGDDAYTVNITASDLSSILANIKVGDEPWPQQTVAARAAAIMALIPTAPPLIIDASLQNYIVSYRDVDSQPPLGLLEDLAQSCGGVLWITAHATEGAYLWMEDPRNREAVRRFVVDPTTKVVSIENAQDASTAMVTTISAMDILRDPVNWVQDVSQTVTQVSVTWMEEIPPTEQGQQTTTEDHTVVVRDTQEVIDTYGIRDASIATELTSEADALELAGRILALSRGVNWRASGLEYDTILLLRDIDRVDYPARIDTALDLLDATTRIGYAFTMIDMPEWTPAGAIRSLYVEGGTYTWEDGRWRLALTATPAQGQGISARWMDFEGTGATWDSFRPNKIKWIDAYGTEGPIVSTPLQDQLEAAR